MEREGVPEISDQSETAPTHNFRWLDVTFANSTPHVEATVALANATQRLTPNAPLLTRHREKTLRQDTAVQVPPAYESDNVNTSAKTLTSILRPAPVVAPASAAGGADDPLADLNDNFCAVCKGGSFEDTDLLCCETCPRVFHEGCISHMYDEDWTAEDLPHWWQCHFCTGEWKVEGDGGVGGPGRP